MIGVNDRLVACELDRRQLRELSRQITRPKVLVLGHNTCLDNRAELADSHRMSATASTPAVIESAWERWGAQAIERISGPCAFALISPEDGRLHLVRDVFGLAPLFWSLSAHKVSVAADAPTLRSMAGYSASDNMTMLADFISGTILEKEQSFFQGIERVPPAHVLSIGENTIDRKRYWRLSDVPRNVAPENPPQVFRELFDRSVARSIVSGDTTLLLSGGLDSSAIAGSWRAVAPPDEPLCGFSLTYRETPGWSDEDHLAQAALATNCSITEVESDVHDPLADMEFWLQATDGPYHGVGHSASFGLLARARDAGFGTVLCGHGGDEVVSYGFGRLNELATARKWLRLWQEMGASAGIYGQNKVLLFLRYLTHYETFRRVHKKIARRFEDRSPVDAGFLHADLAQSLSPQRFDRRIAATRIDHDERMLHEEALSLALQPASLEVFALCSRAVGVDTRMPFYDRELVELSLALPSHWKLRGGLSRYILRAAMEGRLPPSLLRRRDKFDFSKVFIAGLVANRTKVLDLTEQSGPLVAEVVNPERLRQSRTLLTQNGTAIAPADAFFLWRVAMLRMWSDVSRRKIDPQPLTASETLQ